MKLKAKINIYTAGMFILLLIILNSLIFLLFSQMMLDNEVDRSYAEAVKTVKGIREAGEDVKTGELLRAYLQVDGMFKIVNEYGDTTSTITDTEFQILQKSLIFLFFIQLMLNNEVDISYAEAVKTVKGISEAGEDVKTGELLRAYLPVEGMFKIVNEDGESTRTITDPELQHLKDFKTKYYDSEKYTTIKIGKDSYIFVSVPMITEKGEVANLQLME